MTRTLRLTRRAEASLVEIARWTIETFGAAQASAYEAELLERCQAILDGRAYSRSCAALVDGASRLGAFKDVIFPQLLPGIISTALFTFILSWNEYLYALVLVNSDNTRPLTTGVMNMLISSFNVEWSLLMAASVMMSVPLIIVFAFLQSYLTRGFGAGGVKG